MDPSGSPCRRVARRFRVLLRDARRVGAVEPGISRVGANSYDARPSSFDGAVLEIARFWRAEAAARHANRGRIRQKASSLSFGACRSSPGWRSHAPMDLCFRGNRDPIPRIPRRTTRAIARVAPSSRALMEDRSIPAMATSRDAVSSGLATCANVRRDAFPGNDEGRDEL
jgi:hypothetical protein